MHRPTFNTKSNEQQEISEKVPLPITETNNNSKFSPPSTKLKILNGLGLILSLLLASSLFVWVIMKEF